ncbi:MAG: hypothetical protein JRN21_00050 [Nitrososphaerota archaeon]|nr:hypothetical protein [Nitrososphaerota archaeon]
MDVLFICIGNINRSQIAEAIFNRLSVSGHAKSAGLKPRRAGILLAKEHNNPVEVMKGEGYDLSKAKIKRVTRKMVEAADKTVLICRRENLAEAPDFLKGRPNVEFWDMWSISDETAPVQYSALERKRIKLIEAHVRDLIKRSE